MNDIAIIGYFGWYGSICEWVADAFENLVYEVTRYDRKLLPNIGTDHQLYVFVDCSEDYSSNIPNLKGYKVFWSMDSGMPGGVERSTNIGRKCDLVFSSNQEQGVDLLKKFGIDSYLLPVTYSTNLIMDTFKFKKCKDVAMVGNPNSPQRIELWNLLKSNYTGFVGRAEIRDEYVKAFGEAKIVINQPTEPFDNILNNRFFEGMACGALVLQKMLRTTLIEDLGFEHGKDFIYWNDFPELIKLIDYYRYHKNNLERLAITQNGFRKVTNLSMTNQVKKMLKTINDRTKVTGLR